jgi:hypothetical protein
MKSKLTILSQRGYANCIIGCMMLALLTPTSLKAQQETAYGTSRQPQTCPSRSEPRKGLISAAQAMKYATCEAEGDKEVPSPGKAYFLDILSLQVSSPRRVSEVDVAKYQKTINTSKPVYDIKGRAVSYVCSQIAGTARFAIAKRGKNCLVWGSTDNDSINSLGECYTDFADKWRCKLSVGKIPVQGPPPAK